MCCVDAGVSADIDVIPFLVGGLCAQFVVAGLCVQFVGAGWRAWAPAHAAWARASKRRRNSHTAWSCRSKSVLLYRIGLRLRARMRFGRISTCPPHMTK